MNCSVKFLEPTVIVGPPPPPPCPPPPALPHPESATRSARTSATSIAVRRFVSIFIYFSFSSGCLLAATLAGDEQALRREGPLQDPEDELRDDCQHRDGQGAADLDGQVVTLEAEYYQVPQPAAADEGGKGGARDDLHRGGADAREDHGQRDRELYAGQDLAARESHPSRRVYYLRAHLAQPGRSVDQDRRHRQQHERDERRVEPEPQEREDEREDRQRRHRSADVARIYGYRRGERRAVHEQRDRQRNGDPDQERHDRELDMYEELVYEVRALEDLK